ncbi:hypothetical protein [Rhizobium ruizarguesonis]|uniref:hypothetical protein n=1 Tax=Rhizobium ruizarguesonis TaxID=2081791 RepID=UPI00102FE584|nr:hypothetical protein [Rhizobium ruizarguesonis]TAV04044.1 hypothetical protein ELI39_01465 [Rhizobium ruizarguesonis]
MSAKKKRPAKGGQLPTNPSERDLASFTGMSRRQIWQAKKIAEIPEDEFDRMVESDNPPTVTELLNVAQRRAGSKRKLHVCPHCGGALATGTRGSSSLTIELE